MKRKSLLLIFVALAAAALVAQEKKESAKKASAVGILHPEMAVETGTWDKPAATIGTRPPNGHVWSDTTIAAGVDKKPEPGHPITRVGEIIDLSCYVQLGKHGEKHRSCGQKCVMNGQPIGLLTQDGGIYLIMPEEHDPRRDGTVDAKAFASERMGQIVEVNGTTANVGGYRAIYVDGLTK